jgi:REP element-mobilizing transposase RayT
MANHVHRLISIPPKYAVSEVIGYIKGKSAIHLRAVQCWVSVRVEVSKHEWKPHRFEPFTPFGFTQDKLRQAQGERPKPKR